MGGFLVVCLLILGWLISAAIRSLPGFGQRGAPRRPA
jgi:hypothetical protein